MYTSVRDFDGRLAFIEDIPDLLLLEFLSPKSHFDEFHTRSGSVPSKVTAAAL